MGVPRSNMDLAIRTGLAKAMLQPCLMCLQEPDMAGSFYPYDSRSWGSKENHQQRVIFYSLCHRCHDLFDSQDFEDQLRRRREGWMLIDERLIHQS